MRKLRSCICIALCLLLLSGCSDLLADFVPASTEPPVIPSEAPTVPPAPDVTEAPSADLPEPTQLPEPTAPEHSELYIPGLSVEDVIVYFNEVCLDAEFVHSGDATVLQKWEDPIYCSLFGDYTEEDYATLTAFFSWLNTVDGFPGISLAEDRYDVNLLIHFCSQDTLIEIMGENFYDTDGGVTFWYDGENRIYDATICYRDDLDQHLRNSVILEEIYNGLGPVQDTDLREDSIIYSQFSQPQALTEIDELILRLLYHPDMQCGMSAAECETVIRRLYY